MYSVLLPFKENYCLIHSLMTTHNILILVARNFPACHVLAANFILAVFSLPIISSFSPYPTKVGTEHLI